MILVVTVAKNPLGGEGKFSKTRLQQTALPKELTASHPKGSFADDFTFPKGGICWFRGRSRHQRNKHPQLRWVFRWHLERRRRYHHLRLYLDDGHHATLQCMAIRTDGPMLGESHDLKLGVFQNVNTGPCKIPPPLSFLFFGFFGRFLSVHLMVVNEGRFSVDFMSQR